MTTIFGVDIKAELIAAFDGQLPPVTLHKFASTIDAYGAPVKTSSDYTGEGVRLRWKTEVAVARGYPSKAIKIIVLQDGLVTPSTGDEITISGERFEIIDIEKDPVDATWTLAGMPIA